MCTTLGVGNSIPDLFKGGKNLRPSLLMPFCDSLVFPYFLGDLKKLQDYEKLP